MESVITEGDAINGRAVEGGFYRMHVISHYTDWYVAHTERYGMGFIAGRCGIGRRGTRPAAARVPRHQSLGARKSCAHQSASLATCL